MKKYPLMIIFAFTVLALSLFDILKSDKSFSELENRTLTQRPKFTLESYFDSSFGPKYEKYINDQFVFRDSWIDIKSLSERALGKLENNNIIFGKEDYLFDRYDKLDLEQQEKNVLSINEFIKKVNANVTTMIVPNSYEVYRDYLYFGLPMVDQKEGLDEIYSKLNSNNINLFKVFDENKDNYLYYKTDHHWTTEGAYIAYSEFIKSLGDTPVDLNTLEKHSVNDFLGTYFSRGKPLNPYYDTLTYYEEPNVEMTIGEDKFDTLYDLTKLEERDKYGMFINGNNPLTVIKNNDLNNGKKILVIKDSFANSLVPFLSYNFEEIHVVDLRSFNQSISTYVNDNSIEDVLILYNFSNFNIDNNLVKLKY